MNAVAAVGKFAGDDFRRDRVTASLTEAIDHYRQPAIEICAPYGGVE